MIILRRGKLAILEIGSMRGKLLIGPGKNKPFSDNDFIFDRTPKLEIGNGVQGGKMNMNYWNSNVLPDILKLYKKALDNGVKPENIKGAATAWARNINNLEEVEKTLPINIQVLSEEEEAGMAIKAFLKSTRRNIKAYDYLVSIDPGGMSTEIVVINPSTEKVINSTSLNVGALNEFNISKELKKLDQFKWLQGESNVLVICTGDTIRKAAGGHDKEVDMSVLNWHRGLNTIYNAIGNHPLVSNATGSTFGIYYSNL